MEKTEAKDAVFFLYHHIDHLTAPLLNYVRSLIREPPRGEEMEKTEAKNAALFLYHHIDHLVFHEDDLLRRLSFEPFLYDLVLQNDLFHLLLIKVKRKGNIGP